MTQYNCNDASNTCIVQLQIPFSCLFMIILLGTVSFQCLCLFWHLFLRFPLYFNCSTPQIHYYPLTTTKYFVYVVAIYVLSICLKICEKIHWVFLVSWISAIYLPIFSIFQCIPPQMYAVTLILHTFTYHTEHVITLKQHLLMFYFV